MKCLQLHYGGKVTEWIQIAPGRWGLVGQKAEIFQVQRRGWGVVVQDEFIAYYPRREKAMQAALDYLEYQSRFRARHITKWADLGSPADPANQLRR